ncbi:MAG: type I secretion system permease/ATPase [Sneathiellaceae bacterium]
MRFYPRSEIMRDIFGQCVPALLLIVLFSFGIGLLFFVMPLYMMQVFDRVMSSQSGETLLFLTVIALFALGVNAFLEGIRGMMLVRLGTKADKLLVERLLSLRLDDAATKGNDAGSDLLSQHETYRSTFAGPGLHNVFELPFVPLYILAMFIVSPYIGALGVVGLLISVGVALGNQMITSRNLHKSLETGAQSKNMAASYMRNAEVVSALGMKTELMRRWKKIYAEGLTAQNKAMDGMSVSTGITKNLQMVLQISIIGAGMALVIAGNATPGETFAAMFIMGRMIMPVSSVVMSWRSIVEAMKSFTDVDDTLSELQDRQEAMQLPPPEGNLSVERLTYVPGGSKSLLLKGLSFDVATGTSLGVIGPSASGKSTLAKLMVGVWKPASGHVRLDGADVYTWPREDFGRHVGYLPQDIELFEGTVRENIARFREAVPEDVVEAAQLAGVHDLILRLSDGYDTDIGPGGTRLSGGQRQRIALARAVFGHPRLVILDEPNSNLDSEGEAALSQMLRVLKERGTTVVIISHRPHVLGMVDNILIIRDGQVEALGKAKDVVPRLVSGPGAQEKKSIAQEADTPPPAERASEGAA